MPNALAIEAKRHIPNQKDKTYPLSPPRHNAFQIGRHHDQI